MYKSVLGIAAGSLLAVSAASGPATAAEQRQAQNQVPAVHHQNVSEEFSSQRRYRRHRVVRRYWAPRRAYRFYGPGPYVYASPYGYPYPYASYAYPYRYYGGPHVSFGFGPFGFGVW
jgi:hypothetical protein